MHDLASDRNGSGSGSALKLTDDKQIGHAVKRLQKIREEIRQGEEKNVFKYAAGGKIFFHRGTPFRNWYVFPESFYVHALDADFERIPVLTLFYCELGSHPTT